EILPERMPRAVLVAAAEVDDRRDACAVGDERARRHQRFVLPVLGKRRFAVEREIERVNAGPIQTSAMNRGASAAQRLGRPPRRMRTKQRPSLVDRRDDHPDAPAPIDSMYLMTAFASPSPTSSIAVRWPKSLIG